MISECLDVRMWKASSSNNVISFNIMSTVCGKSASTFQSAFHTGSMTKVYTLNSSFHLGLIQHRFVLKVKVDSTVKYPSLFLCHRETNSSWSRIQAAALKGGKAVD